MPGREEKLIRIGIAAKISEFIFCFDIDFLQLIVAIDLPNRVALNECRFTDFSALLEAPYSTVKSMDQPRW